MSNRSLLQPRSKGPTNGNKRRVLQSTLAGLCCAPQRDMILCGLSLHVPHPCHLSPSVSPRLVAEPPSSSLYGSEPDATLLREEHERFTEPEPVPEPITPANAKDRLHRWAREAGLQCSSASCRPCSVHEGWCKFRLRPATACAPWSVQLRPLLVYAASPSIAHCDERWCVLCTGLVLVRDSLLMKRLLFSRQPR